MSKLKIGVLGSGRGSNFEAIARSVEEGRLDVDVRVVISDVEASRILELARTRKIRAEFVHPGNFQTKMAPASEIRVVEILREEAAELVVLAGYMRVIKQPLLKAFPRRIVNIHPSLLPRFPGLEAWKQALEAGEKETGCTVHYVDANVDAGEIIDQEKVPILPSDTASSLHDRIHAAEHLLYPRVLAALAKQFVDIARKV